MTHMIKTSFSFRLVNKTTGELVLDTFERPNHTASEARLRELSFQVFNVLNRVTINNPKDSLELNIRVNREKLEQKIKFDNVY